MGMTRDEIINGLEREVKSIRKEPQGKMLGLFMTVDEAEDIITLLKEQEAVPVIQREVMHMLVWCCGSCGVAITDGDKFCRICGKKVKWDDRPEKGD